MFLVDFFKGIGHLLAHAFAIVKKVVPEEQLAAGIALVRQAAQRFVDNAERRNWVIAQLQSRFHIPESIARLIVELAVQHVKQGVDDGIDTLTRNQVVASTTGA
jgi:hypothetical protein